MGVCLINVQQDLKRKTSRGVLQSRVIALSYCPLCIAHPERKRITRKDRKTTRDPHSTPTPENRKEKKEIDLEKNRREKGCMKRHSQGNGGFKKKDYCDNLTSWTEEEKGRLLFSTVVS